MSSAELAEWMAFASVEPLPDPYWTSALQCLVISSTAGSGGGKRPRLEDFLPVVRRPRNVHQPVPKRLSAEQSAGLLGRLMREVMDPDAS